MSDAPPLPPDNHPIWLVWNHNLHSNDIPWRIQCAKAGCWECHRCILASYRRRLQLTIRDRECGVTRFPDPKRDADFAALREYAAYRALTPFKRNRGRPRQSIDDIHRECALVGEYIKEREAGRSHLDALMEVAERNAVSERTIDKALSLYLVNATK